MLFNKVNVSKNVYDFLLKYKESCLNGNYTGIINIFSKYNKELIKEIIKITNFLDKDATLSERFYCIYHNIEDRTKCKFCNNYVKFKGVKKGYNDICNNRSCITKKTNITYEKKYENGRKNKNIIKKVKETKLQKYGDENYRNDKKIKETNLKKYGTEYHINSKIVKNKIKETKLQKYGDENYLNREKAANTYKNKTKDKKEETNIKKENTMLEKYGVKSIFQVEKIRKLAIDKKNKDYEDIVKKLCERNNAFYIKYNKEQHLHICKCKKCNNEFKISNQFVLRHQNDEDKIFCNNCSIKKHSYFEENVCDFLKSINVKFISNYKIYKDNKYYECDIYLPEYKIGFECNGIYWHSEYFKNKFYHIEKKKFMKNNDIDLFFIWQDDWNDKNKKEIIKSRILSKIGKCKKIYARKCIIKEIKYKDASIFLNDNHLYGSTKTKYNIGLFYEKELIGVMTFSKTRKIISKNNNGYEMIRFATKKGINIVGGMSKLISFFIKTYSPNIIYSYVDLDWSKLENNSYEKIGFKTIKITLPDYWWCVNNIRENRIKYMKHNLIKMGYDKNKTENEIMHELGNYKIYGCGNLLMEMKIK